MFQKLLNGKAIYCGTVHKLSIFVSHKSQIFIGHNMAEETQTPSYPRYLTAYSHIVEKRSKHAPHLSFRNTNIKSLIHENYRLFLHTQIKVCTNNKNS